MKSNEMEKQSLKNRLQTEMLILENRLQMEILITEKEKNLLEIILQMEVLITQREGMIAQNKQSEYRARPMAFTEISFCEIADEFAELVKTLRKA